MNDDAVSGARELVIRVQQPAERLDFEVCEIEACEDGNVAEGLGELLHDGKAV